MLLRKRLERMARRRDDDSGMSIVELITAMGIFTFVLVVFLAATANMARSTGRNQVVSDTSTQLRTVFQRLDKEVRYASDINMPGSAGGDIYLEYWVPANAASGESMCVQWRYDTSENRLQRRTWEQGDPSTVTSWTTMVTRLRNDLTSTAEQPFVVRLAGPSGGKVYLHQRLEVYLDAGLGPGMKNAGSELDVSFVAQNSSTASVTNNGTSKVCLAGGVGRP